MDEKNKAALLEWGPRKALSSLVNVNPDDPERERRAKEFVDRYGVLFPHAAPESQVLHYAEKFRQAWDAKDGRNVAAVKAVNAVLDDIFLPEFFSDDPNEQKSVIAADFSSGKWKPRARTLLDVLAIELMSRRKMLHRCERPECGRYFVKEFSRDRYCSKLGFRGPDGLDCGEVMRDRTLTISAKKNREEANRRRRKTKGKGKR